MRWRYLRDMTQEPLPPIKLDLRGYRCPVPVIRLEAALRRADKGAQILALADDPIAVIDIPHFCREAGYLVRRLPDENGAYAFLVGPAVQSIDKTTA